MNSKLLSIASITIGLIAIGLSVWSKVSSPKIAYVRTAKVVNEYLGMKEARNVFKNKTQSWQGNFDTLQADYERAIRQYNIEVSGLSKEDKKTREDFLRKQELNLQQYSETLEEKAKEIDEKLTQGVLNQINTYVEEYGKKNGYTVILGLTGSGSVMYGAEAVDITSDVIEDLNNNFKSGTYNEEGKSK